MVDAIIVLIVIVLLIFALKGTLKHFKGESPLLWWWIWTDQDRD